MVTALALFKQLKRLNIPKLFIKWPNDILSADKKVCGVLIENTIKQSKMESSVIGIGLNVNQLQFDNLPRASSLKLITGVTYNLDEILIDFIEDLKMYFKFLEEKDFERIKDEYNSKLFRKNKPSTFKNAKGELFSGYIKGISESGGLIVLLEDAVLKTFNLKEITLMY
jgi:BirA family biotin operon repressor/biotin-[acetyl-CoA-carboxylase] ligase